MAKLECDRILRETTRNVLIATNKVIAQRETAAGNPAHSAAMDSLTRILANEPGAVNVLLSLQNNNTQK